MGLEQRHEHNPDCRRWFLLGYICRLGNLAVIQAQGRCKCTSPAANDTASRCFRSRRRDLHRVRVIYSVLQFCDSQG